MGGHICTKAPPSPKAAPASISNPFTLRQMNAANSRPTQPSPLQFDKPTNRSRAPTLGSNQFPNPKSPRTAPPKINPDTANKPFLAPMPRSESPISPAASERSGSSFGGRPTQPLRSQTSPMPRLWDPRPPSPELSANLDCAFPSFPFSREANSRSSSRNGRRTPNSDRGSCRGSSRSGSRQEGQFLDLEPVRSTDNTRLLDATRRRPSNDERSQQEPRPPDRRRRPSMPGFAPSQKLPPLPTVVPYTSQPRSFEPLNTNATEHEMTNPPNHGFDFSSDNKGPADRHPLPDDTRSPSFLDAFTFEPSSSDIAAFPLPPRSPDRSDTFPVASGEREETPRPPTLSRMQSEPALRASGKRPTLNGPMQSEPASTLPTHAPRSTSRNGTRVDHRMQDAPPVPKAVQLQRSDSLHKASGSDSSTASTSRSLSNSNSTGEASPITSAASSVDVLSPLSSQAPKYGEEQEMRVAGLNVKGQQKPGMRAEQQTSSSPPQNFARRSPPKEVTKPVEESPAMPAANNWPLDSPTLPGLKNGRIEASEPPRLSRSKTTPDAVPRALDPRAALSALDFAADDYDPYKPRSPLHPPQQRQLALPHTRARSKTSNGPLPKSSEPSMPMPMSPGSRPAQPPPIPQETPRPQLSRRPTSGGKATCRGCNHVIEGKSVKAADGRLTGRWHKACFTCKTCRQPFTTADFYVINNNPYCEQHYHEKNGSTCAGCHRGIEGQYLETAISEPTGRVDRKFHPKCFTCFDCRVVLSEDYFEIGGRVFCERHALAAMRAQPKHATAGGPSLAPHGGSSLKAERRTTRIMTTG